MNTPTICLNMIVRNEEKVLGRALTSAFLYVDKICIVDTGSTDGTKNILREYPDVVWYERPWVDFATNRNEALELARPLADYILFLDADDCLDFPPDFQWPQLTLAGYTLPVHYNETRYTRCALIKADAPWYWEGVLHEYLNSTVPLRQGSLEWPHIKIIGGGDRSQNPEKFNEDARVLEKALEKEPDNSRYVFYLAQSYRDAGRPDQAIQRYKHRARLGGFAEETWFSQYQIGILKEQRGEDPTVDYLAAYQMRSTRAEPLYQLARYHRCKQNYHVAYMFAEKGCKVAQPSDVLFVDMSVYEWRIWEEYVLSSYYVGEKQKGKVVLETMIAKNRGDVEHFKDIMKWYV